MHADRSFVLAWAAIYEHEMSATEPWLFGEVGPRAAARGHFEPEEFAEVAHWKSPRSRRRIVANPDDDVRQITAMALSAAEALQHRVLTLLEGVQAPTATALLAVALPDRHTILDVRGADALARLGEWDGQGGYLGYLAICRRLATRSEVNLRTLDRALWQWSKAGYPESLPPARLTARRVPEQSRPRIV